MLTQDETRSRCASKEDAHDYRYFPDPDLLPVTVSDQLIDQLRESMPELPADKAQRYQNELGLKADDAVALTSDPAVADYFETAVESVKKAKPKLVANWIISELFGALNKAGIDLAKSPVKPEMLALLCDRIDDGTVSGKSAKEVFQALWNDEGTVDELISSKGLQQVSDTGAIDEAVSAVIEEFSEQVEQYRAGKEKVLSFLVGQVMKRTQGKANPAMVNEAIRKVIKGEF